jgi:hypothetical protein
MMLRMTDISDVTLLVNAQHGTRWSLVGRLPGGYLGLAALLALLTLWRVRRRDA